MMIRHGSAKIFLSFTTFLLANILWLDIAEARAKTAQEAILLPTISKVVSEDFSSLNSLENGFSNSEESSLAQVIIPEPSKIIIPTPNQTPPDLITPSKIPGDSSPIPEIEKPTSPPLHPDKLVPTKKIVEAAVLNAIKNSSNRYPWFVKPTGDLTISPGSFDPLRYENYTNLDARFGDNQPIIKQFNFAHFPGEKQFYWILPGNRIVLETQGWQGGISYQGRETTTEIKQRIKLTQSFWGMQAVWIAPQAFKELTGEVNLSNFSVRSIAGEINNPEGVPAPPVVINNQANSNRSDAASLISKPPRLGTGSTHSPNGGTSLFQFLDAENAPLILQGFPTVNLQALLDGEGLFYGATIPQRSLTEAGISWGNPLTGEAAQFKPKITSIPGLKIGQLGKFDNTNLLNILVNSDLSGAERDSYYLNSLFWVSLGQRAPSILQTRTSTESNNWHRFYVSRPHNRTLLHYDAIQYKATYSNVFANPGASFSFSLNQGEVNGLQTINTTLSLLMGGIFELINPPDLEQGLQEGRSRFKKQELFASLDTKLTADQRRQINQRLNRTLYFANRTSGLEQLSGTVTFPSPITPEHSSVVQIRTGNYQRLVRFYDINRVFVNGDTFISKLRLSNDKFGPLTFIGNPIPLNETSVRSSNQPSNRSAAAQIILDSPDGRQFVENISSSENAGVSDFTVAPIGIRSSDLAFDRIELSQVGRGTTRIDSFDGYLFLPTVEALWAGSSGKWNYTVNSGVWFNLRPEAAFNVISNGLGDSESALGLYLNALINRIDSHVQKDKDGVPKAVINRIPSVRLFWNSDANSSNPAYVNFSYSYSRETKALSYSVTPGFYIASDDDGLTPLGFVQGQLELPSGLEVNTSLELGNHFFVSLEGIQRLNSAWSVGAYTQNFQANESLTSRISGASYGLLVKHDLRDRAAFWLSRIGMSGDRFEVRFEGGMRF